MRKLRPDGDRMGGPYMRAGAAAGTALGAVALVVQTKRASTLLQPPRRHDAAMDDPRDLFAHDLSGVLYVERSLAKNVEAALKRVTDIAAKLAAVPESAKAP